MMMWIWDGAPPVWAIASMIVMPLLMLAFWAAVIWLIYSGIRGLSNRGRPPSDSAEDIARRRFAAGEIDTGELDHILAELRRQ